MSPSKTGQRPPEGAVGRCPGRWSRHFRAMGDDPAPGLTRGLWLERGDGMRA